MKKIFSLRNVLFVIGSLAFLIAALMWFTPYSFITVFIIAVVATTVSSLIFLFELDEKLYARWPWMKSPWFVRARIATMVVILALLVISITLY